MDQRHPRQSFNPLHPHHPRHTRTHAPTLPTLPTNPHHLRNLADSGNKYIHILDKLLHYQQLHKNVHLKKKASIVVYKSKIY